ncbi:hypothetical protein [Saccharolobus islandicus]|uniref:hypothetical protein n=1 Tax=Saccharolobus islandicus TaxID=43080 RepID=UPI0003760241|nr:hypothetical protein [Sulfolobus islandicus]
MQVNEKIFYVGKRKIVRSSRHYSITIRKDLIEFLNHPKFLFVILRYNDKEIPIGLREVVWRKVSGYIVYTVSVPKTLTPYFKMNNLLDKEFDVFVIPFDDKEVI